MLSVLLLLTGIYGFITAIALPFQYRYLISLETMERDNTGKTQHEIYNAMKFEEMYLHANAQGNLFLLPANMLARVIYKRKRGN